MHLKLMIKVFADFYDQFRVDEKEILIEFLELVCHKYRKNPGKLSDFLHEDDDEVATIRSPRQVKIENDDASKPRIRKPEPASSWSSHSHPILNSCLSETRRGENEITSSTTDSNSNTIHTTPVVSAAAAAIAAAAYKFTPSTNHHNNGNTNISNSARASPILKRPITGIMTKNGGNTPTPIAPSPRSRQKIPQQPPPVLQIQMQSQMPPMANEYFDDYTAEESVVTSDESESSTSLVGGGSGGRGMMMPMNNNNNNKNQNYDSQMHQQHPYGGSEEHDSDDHDFLPFGDEDDEMAAQIDDDDDGLGDDDDDENDMEDFEQRRNSGNDMTSNRSFPGMPLRTDSNKHQIEQFKTYLENVFEKEKYLSKTRFDEICEETQLSKKQIRIWFKNKRYKLSYNAKNNIKTKDKKFSLEVRQMLEEVYQRNNFPTPEEKVQLTSELNLTISQIKDWFYRRRRCKSEGFTDFVD